MQKLEDLLSRRRYVASDATLSLSDVRLFVTLIRFDEVYVVYFKTDTRKVSEYPNILRYMKDLWQIPALSETTKMDHIKTHYYTSHPRLNYYGIIPTGPSFVD
jgi:glutathionyl-hydroquinone reductase